MSTSDGPRAQDTGPGLGPGHTAPRRILIVRLSALGDVVMSSGLIPALRSLWPEARLSWLVEPPAAPLLAHNPRLDELIILPRARWKQLWREGHKLQALREMAQFRRELRARDFDLALDPQGLLKSGLWAWLSAAKRRVNLRPRECSQWLMHESVSCAEPDAPAEIGYEYRELARYLGAKPKAFKLDLAVGASPRTQAQRALAEAGVSGPYAVLAPFTTRPQKHWIESRWAELAAGLIAQGLTPVMLGGPADAEAAARIASGHGQIRNLVGQLKLDESVAAIADAALLIGVDTGLTHMGIALQVPTLTLFGSTAPYLRGPDARTRVLYDRLPCSPCHRNPTCHGRFDCMRGFEVPRVLAAALALHQPFAVSVPAT